MRNDSDSPYALGSSVSPQRFNVTVRTTDSQTHLLFGVTEMMNDHSFVYRGKNEYHAFPIRNVIKVTIVEVNSEN